MLVVPGIVAARRFRVAPLDALPGGSGDDSSAPAHSFLAIYEIDEDMNDVMSEFLERFVSGQMEIIDTMDLESIALSVWNPIGPRRTAEDGETR